MLERFLGDADAGVRKAALRSAGQLRARSLRPAVEGVEQSDPEDGLRQQAGRVRFRLSES